MTTAVRFVVRSWRGSPTLPIVYSSSEKKNLTLNPKPLSDPSNYQTLASVGGSLKRTRICEVEGSRDCPLRPQVSKSGFATASVPRRGNLRGLEQAENMNIGVGGGSWSGRNTFSSLVLYLSKYTALAQTGLYVVVFALPTPSISDEGNKGVVTWG
jgi:hypothetical protein